MDGGSEVSQLPADFEFRRFCERMKATKRLFFVDQSSSRRSQTPATPALHRDAELVNANFFDDDSDAVEFVALNELGGSELSETRREEIRRSNAEHRRKWTECCRNEFTRRKRQFASRFSSPSRLYALLALTGLLVAVVLFTIWPVWDVFIDLEAEDHYKTLGIEATASPTEIKKAYRTLTKQWHPDVNPNCGQPCRDMMMKLQLAHDVLLAKGDRREELSNRYREALLQIRSLLVFRLYTMSFHAAEYVNKLLLTTFVALKPHKGFLRYATRIGFVVLFTVLEIIHVTGVNVIILLQVFYFAATMLRQSAALTDIQKISKWSYFDIRRDFVYFVLPTIALHTWEYWVSGFLPTVGVYTWQLSIGAGYLCAHLSRFGPNLFDNVALRKCSVTLEYLRPPELRFSRLNFVLTELGFLLDDLFAFSSHVPSVYRVVVYLVHAVYLAQLALLPWDDPVKGKLQRRVEQSMEGDEKSAARRKKAATSSSSAGKASCPVPGSSKEPITEREMSWFVNLDAEECTWFDLVASKYAPALQRLSTAASKQSAATPQTKIQVSLLSSSDMTEVLLCVVSQGPSGTHIDIRERCKDAVTARHIAREGGPNGVAFGEPGVGSAKKSQLPLTPETVALRHAQLLGHQPQCTTSMLYRRHELPHQLLCAAERGSTTTGGVGVAVLLLLGAALTALACAIRSRSVWLNADTATLAEWFDPLRLPTDPARFTLALPQGHLLNQGAGLLVLSTAVALVGPDLLDTLRQMSLYQSPDEERDSHQMQRHKPTSGAKASRGFEKPRGAANQRHDHRQAKRKQASR